MSKKDADRLVLMSKFELELLELIAKHSVPLNPEEIRKSLNSVSVKISQK